MNNPKMESTTVAEIRKGEASSNEHELDDFDDAGLPARYRGTAADQRDMSMLGKKQVLRVCDPSC